MNSNGPVVIIEDDIDDQQMLQEVFKKLGYGNPVLVFFKLCTCFGTGIPLLWMLA